MQITTLTASELAEKTQKHDNLQLIDTLLVEAHFAIDRTNWGIIYGSARFFEHLGMHQVFDEISLCLRLVLVRTDG